MQHAAEPCTETQHLRAARCCNVFERLVHRLQEATAAAAVFGCGAEGLPDLAQDLMAKAGDMSSAVAEQHAQPPMRCAALNIFYKPSELACKGKGWNCPLGKMVQQSAAYFA